MSSTSRRAQGPASHQGALTLCAVFAAILALALIADLSLHLGVRIAGLPEQVPANPSVLVKQLFDGHLVWPTWSTVIAAVLTVVLSTTTGLLVWAAFRGDGHVDRAARWMGSGRQIAPLTVKAAGKKAQAFGVSSAGLPVGRSIQGNKPLVQDWEGVSVDVWGPRKGKTASRAIPAVLAAPGPVVATSNKRDLVDACRDLRAEQGPVWVFDPQGVAGELVSWWWNPLSYVRSERHALEMADVFAMASREVGARTDAFFDGKGMTLVAHLLLAAAAGGRSLTQVYLWLTEPTNTQPVRILEASGYRVAAADLRAEINSPDKQRGGVFGTGLAICSFMVNSETMEWVTPPAEWRALPGRVIPERVPEFDPYQFVSCSEVGEGQTLFSLSKEGKAGAGPIVTALTMAVCEAAEDVAKRQRGGRLVVPMVVVLDEAANVCRWRKLPDLFSHYGSRGIPLMAILQSWSQGVEVWGKEGMQKMWSAANVKVYGGGVSEVEFLENVSKLIGDFDLYTRNVNWGGSQGQTVQRSTHREKILDVAELGAMPTGRMVVIASGARPVLARSVPWWELPGDLPGRVKASIAAHDPSLDPLGHTPARPVVGAQP